MCHFFESPKQEKQSVSHPKLCLRRATEGKHTSTKDERFTTQVNKDLWGVYEHRWRTKGGNINVVSSTFTRNPKFTTYYVSKASKSAKTSTSVSHIRWMIIPGKFGKQIECKCTAHQAKKPWHIRWSSLCMRILRLLSWLYYAMK